jgi:hypothetical protein
MNREVQAVVANDTGSGVPTVTELLDCVHFSMYQIIVFSVVRARPN